MNCGQVVIGASSEKASFEDRFKKARQQTTTVVRLFIILGVLYV
jgi:hypothetical protein